MEPFSFRRSTRSRFDDRTRKIVSDIGRYVILRYKYPGTRISDTMKNRGRILITIITKTRTREFRELGSVLSFHAETCFATRGDDFFRTSLPPPSPNQHAHNDGAFRFLGNIIYQVRSETIMRASVAIANPTRNRGIPLLGIRHRK